MSKLPILGVCLGHQASGEVFGGKIVPAKRLMHGKTSMIVHRNLGVFAGLPQPFEATRYHSLVVRKDSMPPKLEVMVCKTFRRVNGVFMIWAPLVSFS